MTLAVITARGGSKRIPDKNIKAFCGKPIISYSIEAAIKSKVFDIVMVSTDSERIADIAASYGAEVPFLRSAQTSNDHASTVDVIEEVLQQYRKIGMNPERTCCIYPTAPFITAERLIEAHKMLLNDEINAVVPIVRFSFPPQRCFVVNERGRIGYKWRENERVRSQDLEPMYHDAGQFYFIKTRILLKDHTLIPQNTLPIIMNEMEVQDIDNPEDWAIAELKYTQAHPYKE